MGWNQSAAINLDVIGSPKKCGKKGPGEGWDLIKSGELRATAAGPTEEEDEEPEEYPPWLNDFAGAQPLAMAAQL